jgi:hypothetical protein
LELKLEGLECMEKDQKNMADKPDHPYDLKYYRHLRF